MMTKTCPQVMCNIEEGLQLLKYLLGVLLSKKPLINYLYIYIYLYIYTHIADKFTLAR